MHDTWDCRSFSPRTMPPFASGERVYLVGQPRRRRYSSRPGRQRRRPDWEALAAAFEAREDYQRVLTRVLTLSASFQSLLTGEQLSRWLKLEEALLDHSWLLHGEYFRAGYELGRASAADAAAVESSAALKSSAAASAMAEERRAQGALVIALVRLIGELSRLEG